VACRFFQSKKMKNVLSAFKRSGLFPFNPGAKPDYIYITPSKVYLEDEIAVIQNSQCVGKKRWTR